MFVLRMLKKKTTAFLVDVWLLGKCYCFYLATLLKTGAQIDLLCLYMDFSAGALGIILVRRLPLGLASVSDFLSSVSGPCLSCGADFLSLCFSKCNNVPWVMQYLFN